MPIQVVPQKGRTEAFGDLFSGALGGILAGKQLKRKWTQEEQDRAAQDALRIWQMAQADPLLLQTPQAQQSFGRAGWPMPKTAPRPKRSIVRGQDFYYLVDPMTGASEPTSIQAPQGNIINQWLGETGGAMSLEEWSRQRGAAPAAAQPAAPPTPPTPAVSAPTGTPGTPTPEALVAPPWNALAEQWLQPSGWSAMVPQMPKGQPTPGTEPLRFAPPFGGPALLASKRRTAPTAGTAAARPPTKTTTPSPYQLEDYGRPATQEEFERNVRTLAQTDRQKAKVYYDKWAGLWQ